jgi:hypothetical protein
MLENSANYQWVPLSESEKESFVCLSKSASPQHPTFFNLATDSKNAGGKFPELTQTEIVEKAICSAKWLLKCVKA